MTGKQAGRRRQILADRALPLRHDDKQLAVAVDDRTRRVSGVAHGIQQRLAEIRMKRRIDHPGKFAVGSGNGSRQRNGVGIDQGLYGLNDVERLGCVVSGRQLEPLPMRKAGADKRPVVGRRYLSACIDHQHGSHAGQRVAEDLQSAIHPHAPVLPRLPEWQVFADAFQRLADRRNLRHQVPFNHGGLADQMLPFLNVDLEIILILRIADVATERQQREKQETPFDKVATVTRQGGFEGHASGAAIRRDWKAVAACRE